MNGAPLISAEKGDVVRCFENIKVNRKHYLQRHRDHKILEIDGGFLRVQSIGGPKNDENLFHDARRFELHRPISKLAVCEMENAA